MEDQYKKLAYQEETAIERTSKMSVEITELDMASNQICIYAEQLEVKLAGVLQAQLKSIASETSREQLPPRLEEIRNTRDRINDANYILESILSRLEI